MDTDMSTLLDERLARLTRLAARGFIRALQIRLNQHGVSFGQWIFLRILWMEDGQSQRELAALAGVTEPTTHTALQRLQSLDLITRRNLPGNLRRQHVFLTEKGHALRHELEPLAVEVNDIAIRGMTPDQQEFIRTSLLQMIDNLTKDEEQAAERGLKMPPTRSAHDDI
jgi:DNA-binding MarR family transcriptional regulator